MSFNIEVIFEARNDKGSGEGREGGEQGKG
jgi:hypothetical protein